MSTHVPTLTETLVTELARLQQRRARLAADLELAKQEIAWLNNQMDKDDVRILELAREIARREGDAP